MSQVRFDLAIPSLSSSQCQGKQLSEKKTTCRLNIILFLNEEKAYCVKIIYTVS